MTLYATFACTRLAMSGAPLPAPARLSLALLVLALWMQLGIGVNVIWNHVPVWLASSHQVGAMTVLSAAVFAMHTARRPDPRHLSNMLGKLKQTDRKQYDQFMKLQSARAQGKFSQREAEQMQRFAAESR